LVDIFCTALEVSAASGSMSAALNDTFTSIVMGSGGVKKKGSVLFYGLNACYLSAIACKYF